MKVVPVKDIPEISLLDECGLTTLGDSCKVHNYCGYRLM